MAFSFQHVGQTDPGMGKMPNPDVLARCHASGKRTGAMTQEILFFPLRWLCGPSQHINWGEDGEEGGSGGGGVTGEVIFHTGDSHFRLGLESSAAESELRRSQQCASSGTIRVCHTLVPEPWTDPNITWTLWRCRVLHLSKPFQLSVDTENSLTGISSGKWKLSKSFPGWLTYCRSLDAILLFLFVSNISKTFFVPTQVFM